MSSDKKLSLLHLGFGKVGSEVKKLIDDFGDSFVYAGIFTSQNSEDAIKAAIQKVSLPFVLIDTTASDKTVPLIAAALKRGGFAVLANKKPLSGEQKDFDELHKLGGDRLFYECVVGAGLPVIHTFKNFLATGDKIVQIQGCFSGTLGYIFSQLDSGRLFSEVVKEAQAKGYTEPDPRDDLSGKDVARKALILARIMGQKISMATVQLVGLYPKKMQHLDVADFLKNVHELDGFYKEKVDKAKKQGKVLRFIAQVNSTGCKVGLEAVDALSDIGSLTGPDNMIIFKTKRYFENPLVIKGPGAGVSVTAAGVFADILEAARITQGGKS